MAIVQETPPLLNLRSEHMYLASLKKGRTVSYQIRQSYRKSDETFGYRTVYDLGPDPRRFFDLYNEVIVVFADDLMSAVAAAGEDQAGYLLEQLLWRFLPAETRRRATFFGPRFSLRITPLSEEDRDKIAHQVHLFDRRRLYYLRYGAVDQSRLSRLHEKCCRPLLDTSRDEREFWFAAEEAVLSPGSYLQYVYAIFNLQKHFHQSFASWFPEALPRDEVADRFLEEICTLNCDSRFWQDDPPGVLHVHLRRYLIMFFDYRPAIPSYQEEFARLFRDSHRRFRWPTRTPARPPEKVSEIFATPYEELQKMSRIQLTRLYRRKAMVLHPDRGGDHNRFIELTEVYESLLRMKK